MPSASDLRKIRDGLRTNEVAISALGVTAKEIQARLLECQRLLDPIEAIIYSTDKQSLDSLRKDASNPAKASANLATHCRQTLDSIVTQVEAVLKRQEEFENKQPSQSASRLGGSPPPAPAPPGVSAGVPVPITSGPELAALKQQVTTLQGILSQRDGQIKGKNEVIASLMKEAEGERAAAEARIRALTQQAASFQEEQRGLQGQVNSLTAEVAAQKEARRQAEQSFQRQVAEFQERIDQVKAEMERKTRDAGERGADKGLTQQVATLQAEKAGLAAFVERQEGHIERLAAKLFVQEETYRQKEQQFQHQIEELQARLQAPEVGPGKPLDTGETSAVAASDADPAQAAPASLQKAVAPAPAAALAKPARKTPNELLLDRLDSRLRNQQEQAS